jgi:hypothetical protein
VTAPLEPAGRRPRGDEPNPSKQYPSHVRVFAAPHPTRPGAPASVSSGTESNPDTRPDSADSPRSSGPDVLDQAVVLRAGGATWRDAAARLGYAPGGEALRKLASRARTPRPRAQAQDPELITSLLDRLTALEVSRLEDLEQLERRLRALEEKGGVP